MQNANAGRVIDPKIQSLGLLFTENMEVTSMTSVIYGRSDSSSALNYKICKTITDVVCTAATEIMIIQFFSLCDKPTDTNCIEEVWARTPGGTKISGTYQRHLPSSGTGDFPGEPRMNLPASKGSGFVVKMPGVTHKGGSDDYLVALSNNTTIFKLAGEAATNYTIGVQGLVGAITPFEIIRGGFRAVRVNDGYGSDGGVRVTDQGDTCFATEDGICAATRDFAPNQRFGLSLRLSQRLSGWFHGRIAEPTISTAVKENASVISIEAKPVRVAALDFLVPTSEVSQEVRDMIFNGEEWGVDGNEQGVKIVTGLEDDRAQTLLKLFTPNFKDRATRTNDYWTFKTLSGYREDVIYKCSREAGTLGGIVTTNSLLYSAGPPSFNSSEGSLDYRVSSPHFESNGKEASGTYDLLIRSDVARCIYGFTSAPIKASIEVLSSDGTSKVASTVINEQDGWLKMSASGFGFSSPIVRAKVTQEKVEAKAVVKKKAIICVKGSSTKKITGQNPKCPQGWKKKI